MFDLVNRLRDRAKNWPTGTADAMLDNDAADKIAKLQAENTVLRGAVDSIRTTVNAVDEQSMTNKAGRNAERPR